MCIHSYDNKPTVHSICWLTHSAWLKYTNIHVFPPFLSHSFSCRVRYHVYVPMFFEPQSAPLSGSVTFCQENTKIDQDGQSDQLSKRIYKRRGIFNSLFSLLSIFHTQKIWTNNKRAIILLLHKTNNTTPLLLLIKVVNTINNLIINLNLNLKLCMFNNNHSIKMIAQCV